MVGKIIRQSESGQEVGGWCPLDGHYFQPMPVERNRNSQLECIIVKFDDEKCGAHHRSKYSYISQKYKNDKGTPIFRHEHEYRKCKGGRITKPKLYQFPLRLNYASTAHRMQVTKKY